MIINIRNFSITLCLLVVAAIFSVPPVTAGVCGDESTTYNLTIRIVQDRPAAATASHKITIPALLVRVPSVGSLKISQR